MVLHHDGAAVELVDVLAIFAPGDDLAAPGDIFLARRARAHADVEQVPQDVLELGAGAQIVHGQVVDARIGLVADDEPPPRIHHAEADGNIVDRRVEPDVLPLEFELALLRAFGAGDLVGDVLVRHHPAQALGIDMGGFDDAVAIDHFLALGPGAAAIGQQLARIGLVEALGALPGWLPSRWDNCTTSSSVIPRRMADSEKP